MRVCSGRRPDGRAQAGAATHAQTMLEPMTRTGSKGECSLPMDLQGAIIERFTGDQGEHALQLAVDQLPFGPDTVTSNWAISRPSCMPARKQIW